MAFAIDIPAVDNQKLKTKAILLRQQKKRDPKYKDHPWPFLRDAIYTLDQSQGKKRKLPNEPMEPNPSCDCGGCINYVHHIVNRWHAQPRIVIPKSRRMIITWTLLACHYWLARYRWGTTIAVISRKRGEDDSQGSLELLRRIRFMHDHLPPEVHPVQMDYSATGRLRFPKSESEIIGIAQGADQLRQLTVTAIYADEMAFWEEAEGTYIASIPTIDGGGRFTGVSSANPGFFKQMVHDELNMAGLRG